MSKHINLYGKNNNQRSKTGFFHTENLRYTHVLTDLKLNVYSNTKKSEKPNQKHKNYERILLPLFALLILTEISNYFSETVSKHRR